MAVLLIPGLVFFGAIVLAALAQTANVATKAQTESQQSVWGFLGDALTGKSTVHAITKATRAAMSRWALAQMRPVAQWFTGLNTLFRDVFRTQTEALEGTAAAVERITGHTIPKAVSAKIAPVKATAQSAAHTAAKANAHATSTSTALTHYRVRTDKSLAHATVAVDVTLPQQIGRIRTRVGTAEGKIARDGGRISDLEHGASRTWDWIRTHPLASATAAMGAAVTVALSRVGYGFLRCRSWQRIGRSLTCTQADNLGALLGLAATAAVISDFRDLVRIAQSVEHETASAIHTLLDL